jgi:large subunit ribosomal protein LP0
MAEKRAVRRDGYFDKIKDLLDKYPKIIICGADNVGSHHMQQIRIALRGKAILLMGKNTMMRKAIKEHSDKNKQLEAIVPHVVGNVGFVFTDHDLAEIRNAVLDIKVPAAARTGSISPIDVILPAGPTGLDPGQTSFMQALNIATKINKGQVEVISDVQLVKKGEKVGPSEATLLQKLNIKPFTYGLIPLCVYEDGFIYTPETLDITDDDIMSKFLSGVQKLTALSLGTGIPSLPAIPHYFANAFRDLLAISVATDYTFERAREIKELLENPEALAALQSSASTTTSAAPAAAETSAPTPAAAAKQEEAPKKVEEEEEVDEGFGGLFD